MMTYNQRIREIPMIPLHELPQGTDLLRSPRIFGLSMRIQPTLIADADRMPIMPHDMGTHLREMTTSLDSAITSHDEVVADTLPALALVPIVDVFRRAPLSRPDSRAMNDDKSDLSHKQLVAPRAVRMAARMLISVWMINFQSFFLEEP